MNCLGLFRLEGAVIQSVSCRVYQLEHGSFAHAVRARAVFMYHSALCKLRHLARDTNMYS